jgi:hypothetical protein
MIVTSDTTHTLFGDHNPIGRTLFLPIFRDGVTRQGTITLVGVIGNVKYSGLERAPDNAIYRPFAQQPWPNLFLVARTDGDTTTLRMSLRRQIAEVDRAIFVSSVSTLDDVRDIDAANEQDEPAAAINIPTIGRARGPKIIAANLGSSKVQLVLVVGYSTARYSASVRS